MELSSKILFEKKTYLPRYKAYLDSAVEDGFSEGFMAYYQEFDVYKRLCESSDSDLRELYDHTYEVSRMNY